MNHLAQEKAIIPPWELQEKKDRIEELIEKNQELEVCEKDIREACLLIIRTYTRGGKLLICGNGGSCSDAEHIVTELMRSFEKRRPIRGYLASKLKTQHSEEANNIINNLSTPLAAISLTGNPALTTAVNNEESADMVFAQQLYGLADPKNDLLLCITTSGNEKNIINALIVAEALDMPSILLTGEQGGKSSSLAFNTIQVPGEKKHEIHENHVKIYHAICAYVEDLFFSE